MFGVRSRIEGRPLRKHLRCSTIYEYLFSIVAVGTLVLGYAWLQFTVNDLIEAPYQMNVSCLINDPPPPLTTTTTTTTMFNCIRRAPLVNAPILIDANRDNNFKETKQQKRENHLIHSVSWLIDRGLRIASCSKSASK